jgi:hypothetical protein
MDGIPEHGELMAHPHTKEPCILVRVPDDVGNVLRAYIITGAQAGQ